MSIISKIFCSILFLIFSLNSVSANQNAINNCNKFDQINKELKIKIIDIEFKNYRRWQVNNIRILTNNSHVIPNQFKKKFRGKLLVTFDNNLICSYDAKIRTHGDLKDHIFYKDGKVFQSLDVQLIKDNINGITKFKLFLKGTRGKEEDEIFMTELLREFDFISPRTELVTVKIYDEDIEMLFQEKITKELLEFHKRREGPIFEGEEKYMMGFASKIQNNPNVNWSEIFRVSEIGSTIQLAKQTNSSWSVKNLINQESSFEALSYLNFIYLVYLNSFKDEKNNYTFLDYKLNNNSDDSTGSYDGTSSSLSYSSSIKIVGTHSANFGGSGKIDTGYSANDSAFTVSAFVKFTGSPSSEYNYIASKGYYNNSSSTNYFQIVTYANQYPEIRVRLNNSSNVAAIASVGVVANIWYHIGATCDSSGNLKIYLNGYQNGSSTCAQSRSMSHDIFIG